jgi:5-methylcytosine-specific restriction endonuclease McrA
MTEATPRRSMTQKRRAEVFLACAGRCARCDVKLTGAWEADHRVQLWMGGADDLTNIEALCLPCHRGAKTPADATARAKVKRIIRNSSPETRTRSKRPIRSRGFDKTKTRKFNGEIVAR